MKNNSQIKNYIEENVHNLDSIEPENGAIFLTYRNGDEITIYASDFDSSLDYEFKKNKIESSVNSLTLEKLNILNEIEYIETHCHFDGTTEKISCVFDFENLKKLLSVGFTYSDILYSVNTDYHSLETVCMNDLFLLKSNIYNFYVDEIDINIAVKKR